MAGLSQLTASFARVVRKHRARQGLSQEALAEAAGIHHTYVGLLERGERKPTIDVAESSRELSERSVLTHRRGRTLRVGRVAKCWAAIIVASGR